MHLAGSIRSVILLPRPPSYSSSSRVSIELEVSFDVAFEGAGDVVPRPGAVPKGTAGSTPLYEDTVQSLDTSDHEERRGMKTRGEHEQRRATGASMAASKSLDSLA